MGKVEKIRGAFYVLGPLWLSVALLIVGLLLMEYNPYPEDKIFVYGKYYLFIIAGITFFLGAPASWKAAEHVKNQWALGQKFDWI